MSEIESSHEIGVTPTPNEGFLRLPGGEEIMGPEFQAGNPGAEMKRRRREGAAKMAGVAAEETLEEPRHPVDAVEAPVAPMVPVQIATDPSEMAEDMLNRMFTGMVPYLSPALPRGTAWKFEDAGAIMMNRDDLLDVFSRVSACLKAIEKIETGWAVESREVQNHPSIGPLFAVLGTLQVDKSP